MRRRPAPELVAACRRRWDLTPDPGSFELSWAHVEAVRQADGSPAVLKLVGPGDDPAARREAAALAAYAGEGAVRLLAHDPDRGALLLERLTPGEDLTGLAARDDDAATLVLAGLMRRLWREPVATHPFPDLAEWDRALGGPEADALPRGLVERARAEHAELLASAAAPVLLHGDLHHFNVLRAGEGWTAIDPKGVLGEPTYDTGALLRNPLGAALDRRRLDRRIALLAEALGLDGARIHAWGRTQAVLSAAWSVQDGEDPRFALRCAELLTRR